MLTLLTDVGVMNVEDKIGLAWCGAAAGVLLTFAVWWVGWTVFA